MSHKGRLHFFLRRYRSRRDKKRRESSNSHNDCPHSSSKKERKHHNTSCRRFCYRYRRQRRMEVWFLMLIILGVWSLWSSMVVRRGSGKSFIAKPNTITNYTMYQADDLNVVVANGFAKLPQKLIDQLPYTTHTVAVNNRVRHDNLETDCVPIVKQHDMSFPNCNMLHELDLPLFADDGSLTHLGAGGIRDTWKLQRPLVNVQQDVSTEQEPPQDRVVLKTLKVDRNPSDEWEMSFANFEAVSMGELTKSAHVMNVYGYCGQSTINELGGKNVPSHLGSGKVSSMQKLRFARDAAQAIADVHGTTFVHGDLRPNNFLVHHDGSLKVNDFNRGRYLRWNVTSGEPCGVPWFSCHRLSSPDECIHDGLITEKIDVYQLGHFFYYLLTELKTPYGWFPDMFFIPLIQRLKSTMKPSQHVLYAWLERSADPPIVAIREAMKACHTFNPQLRPSAHEVATQLNYAFEQLQRQV